MVKRSQTTNVLDLHNRSISLLVWGCIKEGEKITWLFDSSLRGISGKNLRAGDNRNNVQVSEFLPSSY